MTLRFRRAVRAVLVDPDQRVLLARFVFPSGIEVWALPGGGLEDGESPVAGLRRELDEELGLGEFDVGPHVWSRVHTIPMITGHDGQEDQIHLVHTPTFQPEPRIGWEAMRTEFVHELRWWTLPEIEAAGDLCFAPGRLAELLADLFVNGPPPTPIDTGV
jgi:ADP-ribose pyrophosphatase YjhB (NUDIX family)